MGSWHRDFEDFGKNVWLNTAHQGPLPKPALAALEETIRWKATPHLLKPEYFSEVPRRLKVALGRLLRVPAEEIILANSATYSVNLLANGLPLGSDDEVLLVQGDFPSNILPWLDLQKKGVRIRYIEPAHGFPEPHEIEALMNDRTRILCLSWVHSFSGMTVDLDSIGALCRKHGVSFLVNASQAMGARGFSPERHPVDAIFGVGYKWLCGPYGTGYCWIRPQLRERLMLNHHYWLTVPGALDIVNNPGTPVFTGMERPRELDVFGTANFFNFVPWAAAIEYLLDQGIEKIEEHNRLLVSEFIKGLNLETYRLLSPHDPEKRSTLIQIAHRDSSKNEALYHHLRERRIFPALRAGSLRFSPHLHNTREDIAQALTILADFTGP